MTSRRVLAAWTAVVVAVLFCAFAGWSFARTQGDDSRAYASTRDRVLADGKEHIARLTSFDAKAPDAGRKQWLEASTGALHDELRRTKTKAGATARATVTDAALTVLDTRAGTAELIATVSVETTPAKGAVSSDRKRLDATLARTADGWKVQALVAVPVGGA